MLAISGGAVNASGFVGDRQNGGAVGTVIVSNAGVFKAGNALNVGYQGKARWMSAAARWPRRRNLQLGAGARVAFGDVSLTAGTITPQPVSRSARAVAVVMTIAAGGTLLFGGTYNPVGGSPGGSGSLLILNGGTAEATQAPGTPRSCRSATAAPPNSLQASSPARLSSERHRLAAEPRTAMG